MRYDLIRLFSTGRSGPPSPHRSCSFLNMHRTPLCPNKAAQRDRATLESQERGGVMEGLEVALAAPLFVRLQLVSNYLEAKALIVLF